MLCRSLNFITVINEECKFIRNAFGNYDLTDGVHLSSLVTYTSQMFIEMAILIMIRCRCTVYYYIVSLKPFLQVNIAKSSWF
jgi:hypothetical protein